MVYYDFLNIVFAPLLKLPALAAIIILSFVFSLVSLIITKYATNQSSLKNIKEKTDEYRKRMKELRKDPSKSSELQKNMLEMNKLAMEQMRHSFKPLIITSIPIILFLIPWMSSVFAYESIKPQQEFSLTAMFDQNINGYATLAVTEGIKLMDNETKEIKQGSSTWNLIGEKGDYILEVIYDGEKQQKEVLITDNGRYAEPVKKGNEHIKSIVVGNKKLVVMPVGYKDWFGWLGTYFIFSIIFSLGLKKVMKVY